MIIRETRIAFKQEIALSKTDCYKALYREVDANPCGSRFLRPPTPNVDVVQVYLKENRVSNDEP